MLRFFFRKKNSQTDNLELRTFILKKLGYRPNDISLFKKALTHKSYSNAIKGLKSNERLEYLGDRVIDLIVAEYLFQKFPKKDEGDLTKIKSKIVSRKMLSEIGAKMALLNHILYSKSRSINTQTLEGNAFEALIGALYLDSGYDNTQKIFKQHIINKYIDIEKVMQNEIDFKSTLLIWGQKNKLPVQFNLLENASKENNYLYVINVSINQETWGLGRGKNKKQAEQNASKETLELLGL
ncbi:MAG: ribonuclease III [Putridiphycobacter sp.]